MNRKRILRSWWLWAAVILFAFLILPNLLSSGSSYHGVSTSQALQAIKSDRQSIKRLAAFISPA